MKLYIKLYIKLSFKLYIQRTLLRNIKHTVEKFNLDVCCIIETWLKTQDQAVLVYIKLRGYDIISSPRARNTKGGGDDTKRMILSTKK